MRVLGFDVICVGGGGAAVTAAVTAAVKAKVALVSKEPVGYGDTRLAVGAMVHPGLVPGDSLDALLRDVLDGGEYLNDLGLAGVMTEQAPRATDIVERFGHLFRRDLDGGFGPSVVTRAGGHSFPRTLNSSSGGGAAMGGALRAAVARAGITVLEENAVYRVLVNQGRVAGVICFDLSTGETLVIRSQAVVLATGGGGWLYYPQTDCSRGTTGDGYSLAYRAGAELVDMEQVQFVPFGITHPASMRGVFLGEPNLAGPAGVLRDKSGKVVLEGINTMTRAQVVRAMVEELGRGGGTEHGGLLLDLSANLKTEKGRRVWQEMQRRGQLEAVRTAYGVNAYRWEEAWDVAPTAHYFMGGVKVNLECETSVKGLFAVGQTQGGVHGANRLGSVSLAELFVFGSIAGEAASKRADEGEAVDLPADTADQAAELERLFGAGGSYRPLNLQRILQHAMVDLVGAGRTADGLIKAIKQIADLESMSKNLSIGPHRNYNVEVLEAIELEHMLLTARAVAQSALARQESRGAHVRLDYPRRDDSKYLCNFVVQQVNGQMTVRRKEVDQGDRNK